MTLSSTYATLSGRCWSLRRSVGWARRQNCRSPAGDGAGGEALAAIRMDTYAGGRLVGLQSATSYAITSATQRHRRRGRSPYAPSRTGLSARSDPKGC